MNKIGMVLGLAAVAAIAGCKDPNWNRGKPSSDVKDIGTNVPATPVCTCPPGAKHSAPCACGAPDCKCEVPAPVAQVRCKCPPGAVHELPCACGAPDCRCVVVKKEAKPLPPPEPE